MDLQNGDSNITILLAVAGLGLFPFPFPFPSSVGRRLYLLHLRSNFDCQAAQIEQDIGGKYQACSPAANNR
jgi:hypothetical protein